MTIEFDGQNNKLGTTTADSVTIKTNDTDALTVDSNQNVGVGTTSPATNLTVSTSTLYNGIHLTNGTNTTVKIIGFASGNDGGGITLATGGTEDIKLLSGTGLSFDGGSNYLDDYEEGTFTPVLADADSGGNTATGGSQTGHYTKIGNMVYIYVGVFNKVTTGLTGSNAIRIRDLPFTALGTGDTYPQLPLKLQQISYSGSITAEVIKNGTRALLIENNSGGGQTQINCGDINSGSFDIIFSGAYQTT